MTAQLAKKAATVQDWLEDDGFQKHLMRMLPNHVRGEQFLALAMSCVKKTPALRACTVPSMIAALMTAARLGLSVDGAAGGAYLVPFKDNKKGITEVVLMPDYRGLLKLSRQSKEIVQVSGCVVYECDEFTIQRGTDPKIYHVPGEWPNGKEPKITHCYVVAWWRDEPMPQFEVMQVAEINKVRASSKSRDSLGWTHWFGEMGKKTTMKRLAKWLPCSPDLLEAMKLDDEAEAGLPQDLDFVVDIDTEPSVEKPTPGDDSGSDIPKRAQPKPKTSGRKDRDGGATCGDTPPTAGGVAAAAPDPPPKAEKIAKKSYTDAYAAWGKLTDGQKQPIREKFQFTMLQQIKDWLLPDAEKVVAAIALAGQEA